MDTTWPTDQRYRAELPNAAGDVAICGSFSDPASRLEALGNERISFLGPLASRADLEGVLRGLLQRPGIRHLVLCGDDLEGAAEALCGLWSKGLEDEGRLPESRGLLSTQLTSQAIDALRGDVELSDWRDRPLAEIADLLGALAVLDPQRDECIVPIDEISERKIFHSRQTSFPIFSNDPGDSWLQLLNLALCIGAEREAAEGERFAEAMNPMVTIGLPVIAEDLEVETAPTEDFPSYLDFNSSDFECYYEKIAPLESVCDRLEQSFDSGVGPVIFHGSRRMTQREISPELISSSFDVVEGKLFGSYVLAQVDVYCDWPRIAMALIRLQREAAERLGVEAGASTFVLHAARLYARDWARARRMVDEAFKRPLPLQVDHSGVFLFGNDGGKARAMLLDHNASTIFWEDAFDTCEELSWYIVDAMPWLLPQHIRYVGQECSTLKRAMREGECYEQG